MSIWLLGVFIFSVFHLERSRDLTAVSSLLVLLWAAKESLLSELIPLWPILGEVWFLFLCLYFAIFCRYSQEAPLYTTATATVTKFFTARENLLTFVVAALYLVIKYFLDPATTLRLKHSILLGLIMFYFVQKRDIFSFGVFISFFPHWASAFGLFASTGPEDVTLAAASYLAYSAGIITEFSLVSKYQAKVIDDQNSQIISLTKSLKREPGRRPSSDKQRANTGESSDDEDRNQFSLIKLNDQRKGSPSVKARRGSLRSSPRTSIGVETDEKNLELQKLRKIFDCFVPKQFQELIAPHGIERLRLGDTVCKSITILFSDIRDFTTMTENMYISDLMDFLNTYLAFSLPALEANGGFVDKFIGDSIMCIFAQRDACEQANCSIKASISMLHSLDSMKKFGFKDSQTGIGINTGRTLVGILGTETRMEPTAIGDSVNLASRTESLCKQYGARLMITEYTYEKLGNNASKYTIRLLDHVEVKGKKRACKLYEVIDGENPRVMQLKSSFLPDWEAATSAFLIADFETALANFKKCLQKYPEDKSSLIYVKRCEHLLQDQNFDKSMWNGVYKLDSK